MTATPNRLEAGVTDLHTRHMEALPANKLEGSLCWSDGMW